MKNKQNSFIVMFIGLVIAGGIYFYRENQRPVQALLDSNEATFLKEDFQSLIIETKLKVYDIAMRKNPQEIRSLLLKYNDLKEPHQGESESDFLSYKNYEKQTIESTPDNVLVSDIYNYYVTTYGDKSNFQKLLSDPMTKYSSISPTHIMISLPEIKSRGGLDVTTNILDAYYKDGKWY